MKLTTLNDDPILVQERTLTLLANCWKPKIDAADPMRHFTRNENADPNEAYSKQLTLLPSRVCVRTESDEPRFRNPNTLTFEPIMAQDRNDRVDAMCTW
jgi:hypothetical protein